MKTYLDCLPCLLNQALKAARAATGDEQLQRRVLNSVAAAIPEFSPELNPPEIAQKGYRLISRITGNSDPFREAKAESNRKALAVYPQMKELVNRSTDRLFTATKLAIIGNSLDLGPDFKHGGLERMMEEALSSSLAIDDYDRFREHLEHGRILLYIGDNAGEIVFDRLLIEEIRRVSDCQIYFVVRGKPVINDATLEDARTVGMDKVATVVSNGSDAPGTILTQCSVELQQLYARADLIIAKGQGNYESLDQEPGHVFFLLRAKCPVVAELLGVRLGDCVLKSQQDC